VCSGGSNIRFAVRNSVTRDGDGRLRELRE